MAITYHAGRRIQGLSNKITYENNFTAPANFENSNRIEVTGGEWKHRVQRGTERTGWLDTGLSSSGDNFVFTLKFRFPARSTGISGNNMYLWFSSTTVNQDSDAPSGNRGGNCIGFTLNTRGNGSSEDGGTSVQAGNTYGSNLVNDENSFKYSDPSVEYTKYLKIIKNGTTVSMTIHDSESDMVAGIKTSGSDLSTGTDSAIGSMNNLRYFKWNNVVGGSASAAAEVFIDDLKFYNNVTAIPDYDVKPNTPAIVNSYNVGASTIITFNESGTFRPTSSYDIEYLVIAGGAGGGGCLNNTLGSAGGGAGGYKTNLGGTALGVTAQTYNITVGSGGAGGTGKGVSVPTNGSNGGNSIFGSITSTGGGGGAHGGLAGSGTGVVGNTGGSGGGSSRAQSGAAASPAGQGNTGGDGSVNAFYAGGGGGGSSAVGSNAVSGGSGYGTGGAGGAGTSSSITGNAVIRAGGGGGGGHYAGGAGGSGGGGGGTNNAGGADGSSALTNSGSGGGGCHYLGAHSGGNGGSGIVILKIPNGKGYELSSPQVGSRYEETDTRKIYHRDDIDFKEENGNEATNYRSASWYEQLSGETP